MRARLFVEQNCPARMKAEKIRDDYIITGSQLGQRIPLSAAAPITGNITNQSGKDALCTLHANEIHTRPMQTNTRRGPEEKRTPVRSASDIFKWRTLALAATVLYGCRMSTVTPSVL
eukprot:m.236636 g.236636  ORF g.236636 m.236636 type:complete len:117 (+) comp40136_c0_seq15:1941-2291(+)